MSHKRPLCHDDYTVGWISALPIELAAAQALLDETHPTLPVPQNDNNTYTLGRIGEHNIVIACLPSGIYGTSSATAVATQLLSSFTSIRFGLMVGIGGGVPNEDADIRLGDVVVSKPTDTQGGVVQYDFGKATRRFRGGFLRTGMLNSPPQVLLTALAKVQANHLTEDVRFVDFLQELEQKRPVGPEFPFARPKEDDHLYAAKYEHADPSSKTCSACDARNIVVRSPRTNPAAPTVHYGLIASGNQVVKDARVREKLSRHLGIYCVEMEAAGLMNNYPCLVVRGICDYADSHKNKAWQGYAAATAAAFAKELLSLVPARFAKNRGIAQDVLSKTGSRDSRFRVQLDLQNAPAIQEFIGREEELETLWDSLRPDSSPMRKVVVLHGMGGMGKTQLAIRFARIHKEDFSAILLLNAKDRSTLRQSLSSAWSRIPESEDVAHTPDTVQDGQARITNEDDVKQRAQNMLDWLATEGNTRWLLIFDNVDQSHTAEGEDPVQSIYDLSPTADHGSVLVTTRLIQLAELGISHPIRKLSTEHACQLLLQTAGHNDHGRNSQQLDSDVYSLASQLDGLPLALTMAGSYIRQSGITISQYLRYYTESWHELMEQTQQPQCYLQGNLLTTWSVTYTQIHKTHPSSVELLLLLAVFDNRDIWFELVQNCRHVPDTPSWVVKSFSNGLAFLATLKPLIAFSLVETKQGGGSYSIHPVIREWCLHALNDNDNGNTKKGDVYKAIALTAISYTPEISDDMDHSNLQQRLLPHADQMVQHLQTWKVPRVLEIYTAIHDLACLYLSQGMLRQAQQLYERALAGKEDILGPDHISTLETVNNLGIVHTNRRNTEAAGKMCQRALLGRENALGPHHASTLHSVNALAFFHMKEGNLSRAEALYKRALTGFEKALGVDHPSVLDTINNLGLLYTKQRKLKQAATMYRQAMSGFEKAFGPDHTSTLILVYNLGSLYQTQGSLASAREMYQRALAGYEKVFGKRHTSTIMIADSLCELEQAQKAAPKDNCKQPRVSISKTKIEKAVPKATLSHAMGKLSYASRGSTRHCMAGWWYCCHCQSMLNPCLNAECCSSCGHFQCSHCRYIA
ncbi:purine and uridine phosphorylase [Aspergillus pseudodeflectus]|uniref:Purine and uridine phosphorylase n=1 Tax=Aspergillus pseudodeflectus TaxID=176178 RepID=A0ABR4KTK9_9EURO